MNFTLESHSDSSIAILDPTEVVSSAHDLAELLMNGRFYGFEKAILFESNLTPDFFELKTGLAGEMLQQFSTYGGYLAIIGEFDHLESKSLNDFIRESNRVGRINFVSSKEEAIEKLNR